MPLVSILFPIYGLIFLSLHQHLRIKKEGKETTCQHEKSHSPSFLL